MARQKKKKFAVVQERENVIEPGKPIFQTIKGNWRSFFGNENPIVLELACGRGEYTVGLAENIPGKNFIGIDIKGDRIWKGSGIAEEKSLKNAAFLRTHISHLHHFFEESEVAEIWIIHPDPRPRKKDAKRRLTHPRFLNLYRHILAAGGTIRLKTDNRPLFDYTLEVLDEEPIENLQSTTDLYKSSLYQEHFGIVTRYETKFHEAGHSINYLRFNYSPAKQKDIPPIDFQLPEKVILKYTDPDHVDNAKRAKQAE